LFGCHAAFQKLLKICSFIKIKHLKHHESVIGIVGNILDAKLVRVAGDGIEQSA
jgi:hypothetical protein